MEWVFFQKGFLRLPVENCGMEEELAVACGPWLAVRGGLFSVTSTGCSGWVRGGSGGNQGRNLKTSLTGVW